MCWECFSECFAGSWFDVTIVSLEEVVRYVSVVVIDAVRYNAFFTSIPRARHATWYGLSVSNTDFGIF